ncbi:hypothetical protein BpHYR1_032566 [Brachionus plicatilis]|uniref:Uncharacterized protein n=1 Tax=Brachionus plicatilis TaxID=10195 RepID=A0A3M7QXS5_BRAPC|nr:hypothetical protein BpHYR1_032566 [Brachionus plicatilis]
MRPENLSHGVMNVDFHKFSSFFDPNALKALESVLAIKTNFLNFVIVGVLITYSKTGSGIVKNDQITKEKYFIII